MLSELFRGLFLHKLRAAYQAGELQFFRKHARLIDPQAFAAYLRPLYSLLGGRSTRASSKNSKANSRNPVVRYA